MTDGPGPVLAEVNVALPSAPLESPTMAGFVRAIDDVNWLADHSPGFVWRLPPQHGPVTFGLLDGAEVIVTLSVWRNYEALYRYVYRSAHALFMGRRRRWFDPIGGFTTAMWWMPAGHEPALDDSMARLADLRARGPSPKAFSLRQQYDQDGTPVRPASPVPAGPARSTPAVNS